MSDKMKLDPCKHCGGQGIMVKSPTFAMLQPSNDGISGGELPEADMYSYFVYCGNCGVQVKHKGYTGRATKPYDTEAEAITAWNRRPAPHKYTVEELRGLYRRPIYFKHLIVNWQLNGWHITNGIVDLEINNSTLMKYDNEQIIDLGNYNKTWVAYDREPEGDEDAKI